MADYKIGIEEEYFLVDAATKSVTRAMPEGFLDAAKKATGGQIMGEFLQSQVEAVTDISELKACLNLGERLVRIG